VAQAHDPFVKVKDKAQAMHVVYVEQDVQY